MTDYDYTGKNYKELIRQQLEELGEKLELNPPQLPRTYGVEIESPTLDSVYENLESRDFLDFHGDVSVENQEHECECDCSDCEHACDCPNCNTAEWLEHGCGYMECRGVGDYQEVATKGGLDRFQHPALIELEKAGIEDATYNETCGLHMNIGSQDLTPSQVAQVIRIYRASQPLMTALAGRDLNRFADSNTNFEIDQAERGTGATDKMRVVNTVHHLYEADPRFRHLEFRQGAGEQFKGNRKLMQAWAFILIELVEFAKTGKPIFWLSTCRTLPAFMAELARR